MFSNRRFGPASLESIERATGQGLQCIDNLSGRLIFLGCHVAEERVHSSRLFGRHPSHDTTLVLASRPRARSRKGREPGLPRTSPPGVQRARGSAPISSQPGRFATGDLGSSTLLVVVVSPAALANNVAGHTTADGCASERESLSVPPRRPQPGARRHLRARRARRLI